MLDEKLKEANTVAGGPDGISMQIVTDEEITEEITDPTLAFTVAKMQKKSTIIFSGSDSLKHL